MTNVDIRMVFHRWRFKWKNTIVRNIFQLWILWFRPKKIEIEITFSFSFVNSRTNVNIHVCVVYDIPIWLKLNVTFVSFLLKLIWSTPQKSIWYNILHYISRNVDRRMHRIYTFILVFKMKTLCLWNTKCLYQDNCFLLVF